MKIIKPYVYFDQDELSVQKLYNIEKAGRLCYKSEGKMGNSFSPEFIKQLLSRGHESVIEHEKITAFFVVDRGISHEIVRHRIASYSQESTRYCNYSADKFSNEIVVIEPFFYVDKPELYRLWEEACLFSQECYMNLISTSTPQEARSVLPNSLKTEIAVTFNLREWRHFFKLRCSKAAHPQMRQVTIPLLLAFQKKLSPLFDDIMYDEQFPIEHYAIIKEIQ